MARRRACTGMGAGRVGAARFAAALVVLAVLAAAPGAPAAHGAHWQAQHSAGIPSNVFLARTRSEPALAIDPRNARHLVAAANPDYYHLYAGEPLNGTFASLDGGASWVQGTAPTYGTFTTVADPSVGIDAAGRAYYLFMGETPSYCGESGNVALLLARSDGKGPGFGELSVVDVNPADDKPFMAVATAGGTTAIYATFTRWLDPNRAILFTRSLDGGRTFTPPALLYAAPGVNMGSVPVIGSGGHLYVLWAHYDSANLFAPVGVQILLRASTDGGRTFGPLVTVASFTGLPRVLVPGALRIFTFPTADVNRRTGALYVAWTQARAIAHPRFAGEMDADLVLVRSRDGGRTWTRPAVLNDTPLGDRFMPVLSVGADGVARVAFYDRRADHVRFGLYGVAARDLGARLRVWPNQRISATLSSPYVLHYIAPGSTCVAPGRFMGDYITAATSPDNALDVMWADAALAVPQESDLWFARVAPGYLQDGPSRLIGW